MNSFVQDLRYSVRQLAASPGLSFVAVLSLALGIGANTAIFSLMDQVLLRAMPVAHPERLVHFQTTGPNFGRVEGANAISYPMYKDFRDRAPGFDGVIAEFAVPAAMSYRGSTERVFGELVSGNYFQVLGVGATAGRTLTPADDVTPGGHPVLMLSYDYWVRRFGGDREMIGQKINLNGHPMEIVGVAAPRFRSIVQGFAPDVYVPLMMKAQMTPGVNGLDNRRHMFLTVMGRLKPGITTRQAEALASAFWKPILEQELAEMQGPSARFQQQFRNKRITLAPGGQGRTDARRRLEEPLLVLMGMVGLVLLIACANVASLLIARAASRQKEIAIRLSLGAGRWRIVRQLMTESLLLAGAGGALGLLVALWMGSLLIGFIPDDPLLRVLSPEPDARVLGFTIVLSLLTGLVFGLIPALQATRPSLVPALKDQANSVSAGSGQARLRKALVTAQVALSLVLLIGAGLFARSLYNLRSVNPGFRVENLIQFSVDPSLGGHDASRARQFFLQLQREVAAIPGVSAASFAELPVLADSVWSSTVSVEGYTAKEGEDMNPGMNRIGPGYFATMGIPLLLGREFTERDGERAPKVAVVNQTMARYYFGDRSPIGRHIGIGRDRPDIEIVGVVKDSKHDQVRGKPNRFMYFPHTQGFPEFGQSTVYVRTMQDPAGISASLRQQVRKLDSNLPVFDLKTTQVQVDESIFLDRAVASLSAMFGVVATLLAAIGLYGVMAYTVARRTREIGVRVALGADRTSVLRLIMRDVKLMTAIGIAIALPTAWALGRYAESLLFGITGRDPYVMAGATVTLAAVALAAGWLPALRAARVSPTTALRYE